MFTKETPVGTVAFIQGPHRPERVEIAAHDVDGLGAEVRWINGETPGHVEWVPFDELFAEVEAR